jgi:hypothetical protein
MQWTGRTPTKNEGGSSTSWDELDICCEIMKRDVKEKKKLTVKAFDENTMVADVLIGTVHFTLGEVIERPGK